MADTSIHPAPFGLPAGVSIVAARETSQTGTNGAIVQGMAFTLQLPGGTTTTVFVPYATLHDTAAVAGLFAQRIAHIQSALNLGA